MYIAAHKNNTNRKKKCHPKKTTGGPFKSTTSYPSQKCSPSNEQQTVATVNVLNTHTYPLTPTYIRVRTNQQSSGN